MKVVITGFADGRKIVAIKGFRSCFLADLKTSKAVMDRVGAGDTVTWDLPVGSDPQWVANTLAEHGVQASLEGPAVHVRDVISVLAQFNPELTVGALLETLRTSANLIHAGALVIGGEW